MFKLVLGIKILITRVTNAIIVIVTFNLFIFYILFIFNFGFDRRVIYLSMHPFHVSSHVHLLLGLVDAIGAFKLRFFTTFPLLVVPEGTLQLIRSTAISANKTSTRRLLSESVSRFWTNGKIQSAPIDRL